MPKPVGVPSSGATQMPVGAVDGERIPIAESSPRRHRPGHGGLELSLCVRALDPNHKKKTMIPFRMWEGWTREP